MHYVYTTMTDLAALWDGPYNYKLHATNFITRFSSKASRRGVSSMDEAPTISAALRTM